jgi:hypothetical protein
MGAGVDVFEVQGGTAPGLLVSGVETFIGSAGADNSIALMDTAPVEIHMKNVQAVKGTDFDDVFHHDADESTLRHTSVDGGLGTDTYALNFAGAETLSLANVEYVKGDAQNQDITLSYVQEGDTPLIDLGDGTDTVHLSAGVTSAKVLDVEMVHGTSAVDIVYIDESVSNTKTTLDLGAGMDTVMLSGGTYALSTSNVSHIMGYDIEGYIVSVDTTDWVSFSMGNGQDQVTVNGATMVTVSGVDRLIGMDGDAGQTVQLDGATPQIDIEKFEVIHGTSTADIIKISSAETREVQLQSGSDIVIFGEHALETEQDVIVTSMDESWSSEVQFTGANAYMTSVSLDPALSTIRYAGEEGVAQNLILDEQRYVSYMDQSKNYYGRLDQEDTFTINVKADASEVDLNLSYVYFNDFGTEDHVVINAAGNVHGISASGNMDVSSTMIGGIGGDTLAFSSRDVLTGGLGTDQFVASGYAGTFVTVADNEVPSDFADVARITDFVTGEDKLVYDPLNFGYLSSLDADTFIAITDAYDGTNASSTQYDGGGAVFIFDGNNNLIYDENGTDAGYTIVANFNTDITQSDMQTL